MKLVEPGGCWSALEAQIREPSKASLTCDDTSILPDVVGTVKGGKYYTDFLHGYNTNRRKLVESGGCWSALKAQIRECSKTSLTYDDTSILPDVAGTVKGGKYYTIFLHRYNAN